MKELIERVMWNREMTYEKLGKRMKKADGKGMTKQGAFQRVEKICENKDLEGLKDLLRLIGVKEDRIENMVERFRK